MAEDDQHKYVAVKARRVGARRASTDNNFEFEEHQMWDYSSISNTASSKSGANPKYQVYNNTLSSSSAPMEIPDWQKIYGRANHEGVHEFNNEESFNIYADEHEMIPPHEYIAKKLASSQISSFSVCEGAGRTLKGRDLSRVRNAILTKTGFIE